MIINFVAYVGAQKTKQAVAQAEHEAELARRTRLEQVLTELLSELQAA